MGGTRTKRRTPTQCTKFDILVPKLKRQKSQSSVTDVGGIVLDTSPHYKYTDCSDGNTQWPASRCTRFGRHACGNETAVISICCFMKKKWFSPHPKSQTMHPSSCISDGMAPLRKTLGASWSAVSCPYRPPEWAASMAMAFIFPPKHMHVIRGVTASVYQTLRDSSIYCCARCCRGVWRFQRVVRHVRAARSGTAE